MTRSALLVCLVLGGFGAVATAQPAGRGPQCGVFEESHGSITAVSSGNQFSMLQLTNEGRFRGVGPVFGCWVELGTADDFRATFSYGYRVTEPNGASKEFGPSGIEAGGSGSTGLIAAPLYKPPTGTWKVEFYTIRRDNGARASLGSVSFTMTDGASQPVSGKASMGSVASPSGSSPISSGAPKPKPGAESPQTATVSTPAASAVLFEDRFASPDAHTPGPRWREYTLRRNTVRAEESPWRINNNSLSFEVAGTGEYIEDLVETVETFPMDNVRVEFEFRGEAGTAKGYVGPTVWWSADARNLSGAGNVSTGPPLIGVQATYRWENRGTRGITINAGGVMKDHPDAIFAGLNEPRFARHVITIANERITYESAGFPAVTYPLASPPRPGERRHLAFGARVYDAGDVQVLQFRNVKITAPGRDTVIAGRPSTTSGSDLAPWASEETAIRGRVQLLAAALKTQDSAALLQLMAPDYRNSCRARLGREPQALFSTGPSVAAAVLFYLSVEPEIGNARAERTARLMSDAQGRAAFVDMIKQGGVWYFRGF